ncbi:MAG: DUF4838 domain-containing protein [Phycisphaerales bacterium]|nr:DUF4838 domain-containing protein [Phycisphaerales bacterium]
MLKGHVQILGCLMVLCGCVAVPAHGIQIARQGRAAAVIALDKEAGPREQFAARELAEGLKLATGATFEIVEPSAAGDRAVIAVGPSSARVIDPRIDLDAKALGDEGIVLKSVGNHLILSGAEGSARGTIYAVETFLEDQVGFRWWGPGETHVPNTPDLAVEGLDVRYVPPVEYREIHAIGMFDPDTAVRNKLNGHSTPIPSEKGGHITYAGPYFVHTVNLLAPPAELFATHPDWYAQIDGQRIGPPNPTQPCLSNPQLLEYVKKKVRQIASEIPPNTHAIISVSQDDNQVFCQCDPCKAVDEAEGSHAGTMLRFVNAIAADVAGDYPNIAIDTLAYQYTRHAPKITRPLPNVIVRLCSIECSFAQPYTDPINASFASDVRDWSAICKRLYIWDYITNFRYYEQPHPNLYALGPNVRFFVAHGVKGLFEQGNRHSHGGDFEVLKQWVLAKLLWNPSLDGQKLIDQFVREYYHEAGPEVLAYIDLLHKAAGNTHVGVSDSNLASYLSPRVTSEGYALLQRGKEKVVNRPELVHRVEGVEASILHAIVTSWPVRRQRAAMAGEQWPFDQPYSHYVDELARIFARQKITALSEGETNIDLTAWVQKLRQRQSDREPTVPMEVRNLPRSDWFDLQDGEFELHGTELQVRRIDDPMASDGRAARLAGNYRDWSIQATLNPLPGADRWTIYAAIRIERSGKEGSAFACGVWDLKNSHMIGPTVVANDEIPDEGYHLYRIGTVDLASTRYVWIAPTDNPIVQQIRVDRIIFVKGDMPRGTSQ